MVHTGSEDASLWPRGRQPGVRQHHAATGRGSPDVPLPWLPHGLLASVPQARARCRVPRKPDAAATVGPT